jgi:hypothetical protein
MKSTLGLIAVLSLAMSTTVAVAGNDMPKIEAQDEERSTIIYSALTNVQDLAPFLFTLSIAVIQGKLQPKEVKNADENNQALSFVLTHSAIIIPSVVAAANAYSRVATIRDTRKNFAASDLESQNALTKQQDQVIANYGVTVPLSILAATRLATSSDAAPRIAYIVGAYLLSAGRDSPFEYVKGFIASTLDSMRLSKATAKS